MITQHVRYLRKVKSWIINNLKETSQLFLELIALNLYAGQEATVKTGHGTTDWFQIGKGVHQGCIFSPCLFKMQSTSWETLGRRKHKLESRLLGEISLTSYADNTTLMTESEELKSLLMKVKEESEKVDLKFNIQKTKIMASSPITSWNIDGETGWLYLSGLQNHCRWWLQPWKMLTPWKESYDQSRQHIKKQRCYFATKVRLVKAMVFPVTDVKAAL